MNSHDFTGLHGTSQDFTGLHGTSQDFTDIHKTSCDHLWNFSDLMSNFICSFECQIFRRTIDKFLVVVLMKGAMKRPFSVSAVAPVKKTGKEKAQASTATVKGQKGKAVTSKLTKGALKAHEELLHKGATDEAQALLEFGKLDKNAQQSLWKAFELQRKSAGVNDDYKSHVGTGAGIMAKKNKLLAGFILDKGTCAGNYKHFMQSIKVSKEATYQSQWITLEKAVQTWGKKELQARVQSGTILMRKNPRDPRFPEFKEEFVSHKVTVAGNRELEFGGKATASSSEMIGFFNANHEDSTWESFEMNEDTGDDAADDQNFSKMLGIKPVNKTPKEKDDPLETMSQVGKDDTKDIILDKAVGIKKALVKMEEKLQGGLQSVTDGKTKKEYTKLLACVTHLMKSLNDVINSKGSAKKDVVKTVLWDSVKLIKAGKDLMGKKGK